MKNTRPLLFPKGAADEASAFPTRGDRSRIGSPTAARKISFTIVILKNHGFVNVIVDVQDYDALLAELNDNDGATTLEFRQRQAQ